MQTRQSNHLHATTYETGFGPGRLLVGGPPAGLPVLLLHGYAASADQWRRLMPHLLDRYRVYAPDLLGFAEAPAPRGAYTAARWVGQMHRLMDALDLPRAVLVGHSLGGLVALTAARELEERAAGLVLIDSLGLPLPDAERALRGAPGLLVRLLRAPGVGELAFWAVRGHRTLARGLALGAYHDPARAPEEALTTWLDLIHRPCAHRAYLGVVRQLERYQAGIRPGELTLPTLILWGAEDRGVPATLAEGFRGLLPQAEVRIIPDTGHVPHSEQPAAVAAALLPLLARLEDCPRAPAAAAATRGRRP